MSIDSASGILLKEHYQVRIETLSKSNDSLEHLKKVNGGMKFVF